MTIFITNLSSDTETTCQHSSYDVHKTHSLQASASFSFFSLLQISGFFLECTADQNRLVACLLN